MLLLCVHLKNQLKCLTYARVDNIKLLPFQKNYVKNALINTGSSLLSYVTFSIDTYIRN